MPRSYKRVVVVAPTRAAAKNIETTTNSVHVPTDTLLQRVCGDQLTMAVANLPSGGFGVMAGTGAGKSVAIRRIARETLGVALKVTIVTQEHRVNDKTLSANVLVITPGVAINWAKDGWLSSSDLIILDEVHQTSDHLEMAMFLLKLAACTFVWLSATVEPTVYERYLQSQQVIRCDTYDPRKRASVEYHVSDERNLSPDECLTKLLPRIAVEKRSVAVFVPTRDMAEKLAKAYHGKHGVHADYYHGGESASKLDAYLKGTAPKPFVVFMTAAGSSSLNIAGLNMVVIVDRQFKEVTQGGSKRRQFVELGDNMMLQMAGRVDGRAFDGEVHIVTNRLFDLHQLRPRTPEFVLAGNLELLAMTTTKLGIHASDLSLIGEYDEVAYQAMLDRLVARDIITVEQGMPKLTQLGERVEQMPIGVVWGEIVAKAQNKAKADLLRVTMLASCGSGLYSLVGKRLRDADSNIVRGSDHLTVYNIVAKAIRNFGVLRGDDYRLGGQEFGTWCEDNGYTAKEIRNIALLYASLAKQLGVALPQPDVFEIVKTGDPVHRDFVELLASVQSMDFANAEGDWQGRSVFGGRVSSGRSVLGFVSHWRSKRGTLCSGIEGTEIPKTVVFDHKRRYLIGVTEELGGGKVRVKLSVVFAGEELGEGSTVLDRANLPKHMLVTSA